MSTRSNIVILAGKNKVIFYRHWDGYLAETGKDIAQKLIDAQSNMTTKNELLVSFASDKNYEITSDIHGDIEYLYEIHLGSSFTGDNKVLEVNIRWNDRNRSRVAGLRKDWTNLTNLNLQSPEQFAGSVNDAIEEMNSIIRAENKHRPKEFAEDGIAEKMKIEINEAA